MGNNGKQARLVRNDRHYRMWHRFGHTFFEEFIPLEIGGKTVIGTVPAQPFDDEEYRKLEQQLMEAC